MEMAIVLVFFAVIIGVWLRGDYKDQTRKVRLFYLLSIGISLVTLATKIIVG